MSDARDWKEIGRLAALVAVWAGTFWALSRHGATLVPLAVARHLTLQAYLGLVQLVALGVGLGAAFVLLPEPQRFLPLRARSTRAWVTTAALTPLVFSLVTTTAFWIARPTLLAELIAGGREAVQRNSGEFGRELSQGAVLLALVWGVGITPLCEELLFRGAAFALVERIVRRGWVAALLVAVAFGLLHWDLPGGLGIVRLVSATGLGLAAGLVRHWTGSVGCAVVLHAVFNALSIASVRRWVVTETFPTKYSAPTLVTLVGCIALGAVAFWHWRGRSGRTSVTGLSR